MSLDTLRDPQYKKAMFNDFVLSINIQDKCCRMKSSEVIEINNFAFCPRLGCEVVIGKSYLIIDNFYTILCASSVLDIHFVEKLSKEYSYWPISDVDYKLVRYPFDKSFVICPLLHVYKTE